VKIKARKGKKIEKKNPRYAGGAKYESRERSTQKKKEKRVAKEKNRKKRLIYNRPGTEDVSAPIWERGGKSGRGTSVSCSGG